MASLCPSSILTLPGSRSASSHSACASSLLLALRFSNPVSVICGIALEFRSGVTATLVPSQRRVSVASGSRVAMAAGEVSSTAEAAPRPFGVLFVCLGEVHRLS